MFCNYGTDVFYVTRKGFYNAVALTSGGPLPLLSGQSLAFKTGLRQTNFIAVIAQAHELSFYINGQYVDHLTKDNEVLGNQGSSDPFSSCDIGFYAVTSYMHFTEVEFSNLQVWKVQ